MEKREREGERREKEQKKSKSRQRNRSFMQSFKSGQGTCLTLTDGTSEAKGKEAASEDPAIQIFVPNRPK